MDSNGLFGNLALHTIHRLLAIPALYLLTGLPVAQALTCSHATLRPTNPDSVYLENSDGTVSDTRNGLQWKRCAEGQSGSACSGEASTHTWGAALSLAASSSFAGYRDWRLPNIKELKSLVEKCRFDPSINERIFPATPNGFFWSASPYPPYLAYAWKVDFSHGYSNAYYRSDGIHVRLVRGGQSLAAFDTLAAPAVAAAVIEFYNSSLDHYFITADAGEAATIDSGSAGPDWSRTGHSFKSGGNAFVCRFYGSQSPGPNAHFYTLDPGECASLKQIQARTPKTQKRWNFESLDFVSTAPSNGICPSTTLPVYRAYNNGAARGVDSNHRLSSSRAAIQEVVAKGWIDEGVVMCAPR